MKTEKVKMTYVESGRKSGNRLKEKYGIEHFKIIGKKGGNARAQKMMEEGIPSELRNKLSEAGRKGGTQTKKKYNRDFYVNIGRKGGLNKKK